MRGVPADDRLANLKQRFPGHVTAVYLMPPPENVLRTRLQDGRDQDGTRLRLARAELAAVERGDYQGLIDIYTDTDGCPDAVASRVRSALVLALRVPNIRE
jgi:guanylate kinase